MGSETGGLYGEMSTLYAPDAVIERYSGLMPLFMLAFGLLAF